MDQIEPGDVFYLLNDKKPHIVTTLLEGGVIDNEGKIVRDHRPVRFYAEHKKKFDLSYWYFESDDYDIVLDSLETLEIGMVVMLYDQDAVAEGYERIDARLVVIGFKNPEGRFFVTTEGDVIFYDDTDAMVTNYALEADFVRFTKKGKARLTELGLA